MVEQFDGEYFEDRVAFGGGCFGEEVEFGRMRSILGILGSRIYNPWILRRYRWLVLG